MLMNPLLYTLFANTRTGDLGSITPHNLRCAASELEQSAPEEFFKGYPKTQRLGKLHFTISEKIDGTNAGIMVPSDPEAELIATSKNGCISVEQDNHGFAKWVKENEVELRKLNPGHHFGEWYGKGINRAYGLDEKRFMLFNAARYEGVDLPSVVEVETVLVKDLCLEHLTGVLESIGKDMPKAGSVHVRGWPRAEGIVIRDSFGRVLKVVYDK